LENRKYYQGFFKYCHRKTSASKCRATRCGYRYDLLRFITCLSDAAFFAIRKGLIVHMRMQEGIRAGDIEPGS
jgi:hypothetical protein